MQRNKIGICEWVFPVQGPEALVWAARLGYDGIQIAERGGYEADYPLLRASVQEEYYRAQQQTGIEIQALHLWSLCRMASMIHPPESAAGKLGQEAIGNAVEVCRQMKIPALMLTSGFLCQIKNRKDFETFQKYLRAACQMAADCGVQVVFESALSVEQTLEMCQSVKGLKICYDLFNPVRFALGRPLEELTQLGLACIDHFHTKDGPENMLGCTLLGQGVGEYHAVMQLLSEKNYGGWLISENYYNAPPISNRFAFDEAAKLDLETMRQSLQRQHGKNECEEDV